jgi:hypothetical protein
VTLLIGNGSSKIHLRRSTDVFLGSDTRTRGCQKKASLLRY